MDTRRRSNVLSVYGAMSALAGVWMVCTVLNAPHLGATTPDAIRSAVPGAAIAAHPHAMGAQGTTVSAATRADLGAVSTGCISCHKETEDPHPVKQSITCVDCHGGDGAATDKAKAHPRPAFPDRWPTAANPPETYTLLNHESHAWIRFMNPSDLRVAPEVCGRCHSGIVNSVAKGSMVNSAQVYSTALYNNASVPLQGRDLLRELHAARRAADHQDAAGADRRRHAAARDPSVSAAVPALRDRTARQHLPRVRARRRTQVRARQPESRRCARAAGRDGEQSRLRHAGVGGPRHPRRAENASERSGAVVPRHERFARATIGTAAARRAT